MTDVGFQIENKSGAVRAKRRAGNEQKDRLHRLHEGASELDGHFSARAAKNTTANRQLSDSSCSTGAITLSIVLLRLSYSIV